LIGGRGMTRRKSFSEIVFSSLLFILLIHPQAVIAQISDRELGRPDAHWESVSNFESMDHRVLTCMEFGDAVIVGGDFNAAGGVVLNHIGSWDGSEWHALGNGFNEPVRCLGIYQGQLIAGGDFTESGGRPISHVARWNGIDWEALGDGFDASPTCFAEWNDGLVAGGWFNTLDKWNGGGPYFSFAAWWDGSQWTEMGKEADFTALSAPPRDLVVYRGSLYAAGSFVPAIASTPTLFQPIARWTGSEWTPMGPRMIPNQSGRPAGTCFATFDSLLIVGGSFMSLESLDAKHIVAFDGSSWSALGEGRPEGVLDLQVHQGRLLAAGFQFSTVGQGVATWDGTSWSGLNPGAAVRSIASHDERLYASVGDGELEVWDGSQWFSIGPSSPSLSLIPDPIQSLVTYEDQVLLPIWYWDDPPRAPKEIDQYVRRAGPGRGLHSFHGELAWDYWSGYPTAIFKGSLIFGWNTWNGTSVGTVPNRPFGYPAALTSWGDSLIAATWPNCWSLSPELWTWDGQSWNPFADGLCPALTGAWEREGVIRVLSPYRNRLIAGGFFSFNDDMDRNLAAWNGTSWEPLGSCPDDMVTCLLEYEGDLIAAGFFGHMGDVAASHIARWDGTEWHPMGLGIDGPVYTLTIHNDRLIAGGLFQHADGCSTGSIAAWDGHGWIPLSTGVDGEVLAMASNNGTLWVGGEFSKAGGETSFHLAKWIEGPRTANFSSIIALRSRNRITLEASATYIPFDHQGFLIHRQAAGESQILITPTPITDDQFSVTDVAPPLGPVIYVISGISSTGLVTPYASTQVDADPTLRFALLPIRPNPFQANATITFHNAKTGAMHVAVYDLSGRRVAELVDQTLPPGSHSVTWNGRDASGRSVAAGTYFCRVNGPEGTLVERLVRSAQ
jgi:trimeric autotransporter adhesin